MISAGAFIQGRLAELDIINAGWRYIHRRMNEQDRRLFEKMINMPYFCVTKFEEIYLKKKIDPFAKQTERPDIVFEPSDVLVCNSLAHDITDISGTKNKISELLTKLEDLFEKFAPVVASSSSSSLTETFENLQKNAIHELDKIDIKSKIRQRNSMKKPGIDANTPIFLENKPILKQNLELKEKTDVAKENTAKPVSTFIKNIQNQTSMTADCVQNQKFENVSVETDAVANTLPPGDLQQLSCDTEKESELIKISPKPEISPIPLDNVRSVGTPDSGMISDIADFKPVLIENPVKNKKPDDPEKLTGRDGRRYRKKREAEKMATEQQAKREEETSNSEAVVLTGKEKRRLKDKLRKEKRALMASGDLIEETVADHETKDDTQEEVASISEEARLFSTVSNLDKPSLADQTTPTDAPVSHKPSKRQKKTAKKQAQKAMYVVNENSDMSHSVELLPGDFKIVKIDQELHVEEIFLHTTVRNGKEVNIDQAIAMADEKNASSSKQTKNLFAPGSVPKQILDNGKWLAYVIDEKDPHNPRIDEISDETVAETIAHLNARQKQFEEKQAAEALSGLSEVNICEKKKKSIPSYTGKLPEQDADFLRKKFSDMEKSEGAKAKKWSDVNLGVGEREMDELQVFLNSKDPENIRFQSSFAQRTAPLLVCNSEFKTFCRTYANSKYTTTQTRKLIQMYIDKRIVFQYLKFKKLADKEAYRISMCWNRIDEKSSYALMIMLFINSPTSNVSFSDVESVLFPR